MKEVITKKKMFRLGVLALCLGLFSNLNAQFITHDFNNGSFGDYKVPKPDQESRVKISGNAVVTTWKEADYGGTNSNRKAQFEPINQIHFTQELWIGFRLKIHSDYMANNTNTEAGLMQIWGFDASGSGNHWAMLKFDGRNGGDLTWQHRYNSSAAEEDYLVDGSFPRNTYKDIIIRVKLGNVNSGTVQIWVDGVRKLNLSNQRMGWGDQNSSGQINGYYSSGAAFGQYNFLENAAVTQTYDSETTQYDGFMNNETRTVSYDNATVYVGSNGYDVVDPDNDNSIVHMRKRNATGFALDGGNNGSNGQNVYLWSQNASNVNQQWIEIDRGNGYYSYQKNGTSFCLDGGNNGANSQNVYLWTCSSTQQNQQWNRISVGNYYRLQKRNASGFSIDGGNDGAKGQNLYLWSNGSSNQNQQWQFTDLNGNVRLAQDDAEEDLEEVLETSELKVYPNPVVDQLTVNTPLALYNEFTVFNINGKAVLQDQIASDVTELSIDLKKLNSGVYVLELKGESSFKRVKVLKNNL